MLIKIAWKNVWRSPGRSLALIMAVAVGVSSIAFLTGFVQGFSESFIRSGIFHDYSHLQIHHPEFKKDKELQYEIKNYEEVVETIQSNTHVYAYSSRTISNGMISSAKAANGISIYGIDPSSEARVTSLDSSLLEGVYFESIKRNPILVSASVAEDLGLKLRSKVVLTLQNIQGDIIAGSFRVEGIFESKSLRINEGVVYVRQSDMSRLLESSTAVVHEIGILMDATENEPLLAVSISEKFPDILVENWKILAPELEMMQQQIWITMTFLLVIVMGALGFGIVNTMLMAVLERVRELGMLMAVGMKKSRVFLMVVYETILVSLAGVPLGIGLGLLINYYFQVNGLDLTEYSQGLKDFGYDTILYPQLDVINYIIIGASVGIAAILASIYPARKATRLSPIEALRSL